MCWEECWGCSRGLVGQSPYYLQLRAVTRNRKTAAHSLLLRRLLLVLGRLTKTLRCWCAVTRSRARVLGQHARKKVLDRSRRRHVRKSRSEEPKRRGLPTPRADLRKLYRRFRGHCCAQLAPADSRERLRGGHFGVTKLRKPATAACHDVPTSILLVAALHRVLHILVVT